MSEITVEETTGYVELALSITQVLVVGTMVFVSASAATVGEWRPLLVFMAMGWIIVSE